VLQSNIQDFVFLGSGIFGYLYRLDADIPSICVLVGMTALLIRRFILQPKKLGTREYLFFELATANIEMFNEIKSRKILTTCPHCLHTIMNEYPALGGQYLVAHHSQLISELLLNA